MKPLQRNTNLACRLIAVMAIFASAAVLSADDSDAHGNWLSAGGGIRNTRSTAEGPEKSDVRRLQQDWVFTAAGDVSATPTVEGSSLYVVDWGGFLYKLDARSGQVTWSHKISDYTGNTNSVSRTSPAIQGDKLVIGDQATATVLAVDKNSGDLIWQTLADPHPCGRVTSSVVIGENKVYVGLSCTEEGTVLFVKGYIPSFRGSMLALDLQTGAIVWKTYTLPAVPAGYPANTPWYSGVPIWASTAALDLISRTVFIGTGNNYTVPPAVAQCILDAGSDPADQSACLAPDDYEDTVLALDMDTGAIKWSRRLQAFDTWTAACLPNLPPGFSANPCPVPAGGDFDFGSGPNLFTVGDDRSARPILGIGQKSGVYWALDPRTGATIWATLVGAAQNLGGIEWGTATDGRRVYVAESDYYHAPYTLPSGQTLTGGSWAALDAVTGKILWQVPVTGADPLDAQHRAAAAMGAVTVSNDVMYASDMAGTLVALDGRTGATLWTLSTGASVNCGPSIVDGRIFWGTGYKELGIGTANNKLYAFSVHGD